SSTDLTTATNSSTVNQSSPVTLGAAATAYALKTNTSIDLGGNSLTLGNGTGQSGLILNSGASVTNGNISFGATEGMLYLQGTATLGSAGNTIPANGLTVNASATTTPVLPVNATINSNITDGTQPSRLILAGSTSGTGFTLNGANTYTGGTIIGVSTGTGQN